MTKLVFTSGPDGRFKMTVEGHQGEGCLKIAQNFANKMGVPLGEPELLPEFYNPELGTDYQQETN
jgi:hypothetical protein